MGLATLIKNLFRQDEKRQFDFDKDVSTKDIACWNHYFLDRINCTMIFYAKQINVETLSNQKKWLDNSTFYISNDFLLGNAEYQGYRTAFLEQPPRVVAETCNIFVRETAENLRQCKPTRDLAIDFFNGYEMEKGTSATEKMISKVRDTGCINPEDETTIIGNANRCIK
jgi:hypothetical protein